MIVKNFVIVYSLNGTPIQNTFQMAIRVMYDNDASAHTRLQTIVAEIADQHMKNFGIVIKPEEVVLKLLTEV